MTSGLVARVARAIRTVSPRMARWALVIAGLGLAATTTHAQTNPYNSLTLEWIAPGDDGTAGQVSGYELRYSTTPVGADVDSWWNSTPFSQRITLGPPLAAAGQTDQTVVNGLLPGTRYYFVLQAFDDSFNRSEYSNAADDATWSCNAPSAAPIRFVATASTGQVDVVWDATSDPLAQSLHLYRAQGASGSFTLIQTLAVSTTNYVDTNVSAGSTYQYRAAYAGAACEGPTTSIESVTVPGTSNPPPPGASASGSSIHAYPNPAGGTLKVIVDNKATAAMPVYLRLFDMNGHWIATVANATYPTGSTEVPWDRSGLDGRSVKAGYYELLGTIGLTKVRERIVLLP